MYWPRNHYGHVTVERKKLYEQVWSVPGSQLAIQYGISDVGLAKVCKRYRIPRPPRGYWAKLHAGKLVQKPPLPKLNDPDYAVVHMQGLDMPEETMKSVMAAAKPDATKQPSPPVAGPPHPLVLLAGEQLRHANLDHDGLVRTDPSAAPDLRVSPPLIDRCLSILDGFVKRWEVQGGVIHVGFPDEHGKPATAVAVESDRLFIQIIEGINESKPITDPARRTGYLTLYIAGDESRQFRRRWSDTKTQRLEKMYKPLIETLLLTLGLKKAERLDRECEERQRQKVQTRRQAAARTHDTGFYWRQTLMEDVSRWHDARRIREYLVALQQALASGQIHAHDSERFKQWFEWAQRYADSIDPAMRAKLPDETVDGPANTPIAELDVTSHTRPVLLKLGVKDTDELWCVKDEQLRAACQGHGRAGAVWDEVTRVLEGLGYDVSKRPSASYWW